MLIVGREIGQSVIIGDVIKVTIQQYDPKLQLVIDAPKEISIFREELYKGKNFLRNQNLGNL